MATTETPPQWAIDGGFVRPGPGGTWILVAAWSPSGTDEPYTHRALIETDNRGSIATREQRFQLDRQADYVYPGGPGREGFVQDLTPESAAAVLEGDGPARGEPGEPGTSFSPVRSTPEQRAANRARREAERDAIIAWLSGDEDAERPETIPPGLIADVLAPTWVNVMAPGRSSAEATELFTQAWVESWRGALPADRFDPTNPGHIRRAWEFLQTQGPDQVAASSLQDLVQQVGNRVYAPGDRFRETAPADRKDLGLAGQIMNRAAPRSALYLPYIQQAAARSDIPWQVLWAAVRTGANGFDRLSNSRIDATARQLERTGRQYGAFDAGGQQRGWTLAMVALRQGNRVADQIETTGQVPVESFMAVGATLQALGQLEQIGWSDPLTVEEVSWLQGRGPSSGGAGGGDQTVSVSIEDRVGVAISVENMIRSIFRRAPRPGEVQALTQSLVSDMTAQARANAVGSAGAGGQSAPNPFDRSPRPPAGEGGVNVQINEGFDSGARTLDALRGTPEYQELYANKPGYLSEEQYATQFAQAGASALGQAPSEELVRSGLRTGNMDQFMGRIRWSPEAQQSSTFGQRMYRSREALARYL